MQGQCGTNVQPCDLSASNATQTTYYDTTGACPGTLTTGASAFDSAYSQGTTLTNAGVLAVATHAIGTGALPLDANGIYLILGDVSTTNSGMCTSFCGW